MTEKRFTVKQRQGATNYSILDYYGQLPLSEGIYYKSNAEKLCKWLNEQHELLNNLHEENEQLKKQLMENNCDNCKYSKAIYADVECRKKGLTEWKYNCDEFKGDVE